jgi:uridine kinase
MPIPPQVVIIGIAGGTASGKSTIARAILESVGAENITHLLHDSYYRNKDAPGFPMVEGFGTPNFDHPDALDTPLLIDHIRQLQNWQPIEVPIYDFVHDVRSAETMRAEPRPVIIVEGILVLADARLRELFDIKIFVDTPADVRFIRRLKRDIAERGRTVESVIDQYLNTVRPMHIAFVEPSKMYADVIIPQGGYNPVAIDLVADRVRSIISQIQYPV